MDEAERSGVDQLIGWPVGRNICLDAVQMWRDGVAGDTLARGHVGKGDYKREAKLTRGTEAQMRQIVGLTQRGTGDRIIGWGANFW